MNSRSLNLVLHQLQKEAIVPLLPPPVKNWWKLNQLNQQFVPNDNEWNSASSHSNQVWCLNMTHPAPLPNPTPMLQMNLQCNTSHQTLPTQISIPQPFLNISTILIKLAAKSSQSNTISTESQMSNGPPKTCPPQIQQRPVSNPITHFNPTLSKSRCERQRDPYPPLNYYLPVIALGNTKSHRGIPSLPIFKNVRKFYKVSKFNLFARGSQSATLKKSYLTSRSSTKPPSAHNSLPVPHFSQ